LLGVRSVALAIAAGNTAVLKGSELSPRCFWAIGDVFREAGLPPGVLNVIFHKPAMAAVVTKALIEDVRVRKVNFTGSTAVGRIIAELAGRNLKPVLLELGGKAPAIVWKDADLQLAAEECAKGAFIHSGQVCMATERVLVHKDVLESFSQRLVAETDKMFSNSEPLINKAGITKNKGLVQDALEKGAVVLYGNPSSDSESRMAPVIIKGVDETMAIYRTESFGPTLSLISIDSEEQALQIANDTEYGLTSAIFTEDLRLGFRMAKGIVAGACHINGMTVHDETALPHGGMKGSGFGRFGSLGLDEWLTTKTVTYKD
jgi:acyl-CoA reductase-like NAD-dependent aldehyde dehydrogenase